MNNSSDVFSIIALLFSAFSLFFSAFSWWETKKGTDAAIKANYLSRLNSLFELQKGYKERSLSCADFAKQFIGYEGGKKAEDEYIKYEERLRDVRVEIEKYHSSVIRNDIYV